jgi:hypothetical protein
LPRVDEAAASTWHFPPPAQRILDLDVEITLRKPAELALRLFDVADQAGRVARPAGPHGMRHWETGYACRLGYDLTNAIAGAASNVELLVQTSGRCALQRVQCTKMRIARSLTWMKSRTQEPSGVG